MAAFFILVMDKYKKNLNDWLYSASKRTEAELQALQCYEDPPHGLPKATFISVSQTTVNLPPCTGGSPEGGTIHGIQHR
jgi:hypothetical protein